jgi:hypothetical protein
LVRFTRSIFSEVVWDIPARLPYGGIVHSAGFLCNILETPVLVFLISKGLLFRSVALWREESAVSLLAASR